MTTKEFIQYVSERPELCEKMATFTSTEKAYVFAKEQGLTDDEETFTETVTATRKGIETITEEDLESVSAAGSGTVSFSCVMTGTFVAGAAGGAAV